MRNDHVAYTHHVFRTLNITFQYAKIAFTFWPSFVLLYFQVISYFELVSTMWDIRFSWQRVWRWQLSGIKCKQFAPLKCQSTLTRLNGTISQKAVIFSALDTWLQLNLWTLWCVLLEHWQPPPSSHSITIKKSTVHIFIAVKALNLI
jgi:hypothetical protein